MADGTTYTIDITGKSTGVEATAAEVNELAAALAAAESVSTSYDGALKAAESNYAKAAEGARSAAAALQEAEANYKRLERASIAAGKAVERAALKGKDTSALQAAATSAAAALEKQGAAVDAARAKAISAAAAEQKLAASLKQVQKSASGAAAASKGTQVSFGQLFQGAGALGGTFGGLAGKIAGIGDGLRGGGGKAGLILGAFAAANAIAALVKVTIGMGIAIGAAVVGMLGFAIASNKVVAAKFDKSIERTKKRIKSLFEGVKTDKLVKPVNKLLQLFDKNTASGKALAKIIEQILNPVIDGLVEAIPLAKEFFKGMLIGALKAINYMKRMRNAIVGAIPKEVREKIKKLINDITGLNDAASAGETTFKMLSLVLLVLLLPLALLGILILGVILVVWQMVEGIEIAAAAFEAAGKKIEEFTDPAAVERKAKEVVMAIAAMAGTIHNAMSNIGAKGGEFGKNLVDGFIKGITGGAGGVQGAVLAIAKMAVDGLAAGTGSHSPSVYAAEIGEDGLAAGLTLGMNRGEVDVREAGTALGGAAVGGMRRESRHAPSGGGSSTTYQITITAPSGDAGDIAHEVERVILRIADGAALQLGGGEVPA